MRPRSKIITTVNMQTDMIARKKANQLWVIIGVCSLGLSITDCDNEALYGNEKDTAGTDVELRFDASISDSPSTKANGASAIEGTAFPDGTHTFGMFITDEPGTPLATGSNDNMKSILTRTAGTDSWSHTDKNGQPLSLNAKHGENIKITGYYPWVAGATPTAVPFDLSGNASGWTDLLYLASPQTTQVLDATVLALRFSHAYCWVTVNLSKLTDKNNVTVSAVSIVNSNNALKRIINKGKINPKTGNVIPATSEAGAIVFNCPVPIDLPLNTEGQIPVTFDFLVPESMSTDTKDFDIIIQVTAKVVAAGGGSSSDEILSFPINKLYLNNKPAGGGPGLFGFEKGKQNIYTLIYNNSEMALSLANWEEIQIRDQKLGEGQVRVTPIEVPFKSNGIAPDGALKKLGIGNYINHSYLGEVAENNNGEYLKFEPATSGSFFAVWRQYVTAEPFYQKLKVARNDAAGGGDIPWKDEATGVLRAKQACIDFREGGYTDWRLPRISEMYMLVYNAPSDLSLPAEEYWSGTEYSETESYSVYYNLPVTGGILVPQHISKTARIKVRCVRDSDKPKPNI